MFLLDLLFPKICVGCGFLGSYICLNCRKKLIYIAKDSCPYCQRPSLYGITHPSCRKRNGLDGSLSLFAYNNFFKKLLSQIKYRGAREILSELFQSIEPKNIDKLTFFTIILRFPVLNPVPLFSQKAKERGFNQAKLVADFFSLLLRLPVSQSLKRIKNTNSQAQIKHIPERSQNMKNAFQVIPPLGKTYIVVDDVITSGATIMEAALTLKRGGASKVFGLTLAKGYTGSPSKKSIIMSL